MTFRKLVFCDLPPPVRTVAATHFPPFLAPSQSWHAPWEALRLADEAHASQVARAVSRTSPARALPIFAPLRFSRLTDFRASPALIPRSPAWESARSPWNFRGCWRGSCGPGGASDGGFPQGFWSRKCGLHPGQKRRPLLASRQERHRF